MTCHDASEMSKTLILPWLMGHYRRAPERRLPPIEEACSTFNKVPISYLVDEMRYDLRRMAISLTGIPSTDHPAAAWAEKRHLLSVDENQCHHQLPISHSPLFPNVELDDAVLHFRCGDVMQGVGNGGYGFMKFFAFARHISPHVRTIGIVTQPFDSIGVLTRKQDQSAGDRCRIVVMALVDYLQERFPRARIRIHNGKDETMALAYARMIMANQTVAGMSSFGVFAVVATFGTGYIRKKTKQGSYQWIERSPRIDEKLDNIFLVKEPNVLKGSDIRGLWDNAGKSKVLAWFRDESLTVRCSNTSCWMESAYASKER
jgi:hypothetical protein